MIDVNTDPGSVRDIPESYPATMDGEFFKFNGT
jgi:hypothetical protein